MGYKYVWQCVQRQASIVILCFDEDKKISSNALSKKKSQSFKKFIMSKFGTQV